MVPRSTSNDDVLHQHARAPADPEVLDDDVRPRCGHDQMPRSVKNSVKSALMTMTLKMASTTAVVVRAPTAAAPPRVASPCPHAINPIASARNGVLTSPPRKSAAGDRLGRAEDVGARRHVRDDGRREEPADERQHVADPGENRHGEHEREAARHDQPSHRIEPHGTQRVDLLRHLHRRDLRREAGARSAGDDDGRDQRAELAELRDDDELGHVDDGAEPSELRHAEKADDQADQQVRGARDRQRVRANLLHQPRQRSPIDRARGDDAPSAPPRRRDR